MFLGGISGSGPANAACQVMIAAMATAWYPPSFSQCGGAAAATDILIPPSVAFIIYSVQVPGRLMEVSAAQSLSGSGRRQ